MAKRLQDNLNSAYIASANKLKPKNARKKVVAYVESYDDIGFWRNVLQEFETDQLYFEVMLPSRTTLGRGKKTVLANHLGQNLGECMIACVDADYDWLMQGITEMSRLVCENPYVFHTYVYAIENYQCYAPALHQVCVMSTLNDRVVVDTEAFITEFSVIIWPLFVWNIWSYRHGYHKQFGIQDFTDTITIKDINPYHPEDSIEFVRRKVNKKIAWMQRNYPQGKDSYPRLRDELLGMGITPETCYLYMQGHALFENVVLPLLNPICAVLRKEREREINRLAGHEQQRQNELSCYQHSQSPVDVMLRKSTGYYGCDLYVRLKEDIRRSMADVGRQK